MERHTLFTELIFYSKAHIKLLDTMVLNESLDPHFLREFLVFRNTVKNCETALERSGPKVYISLEQGDVPLLFSEETINYLDLMAASAMTGMLANPHGGIMEQSIADCSYRYAEALLRERVKRYHNDRVFGSVIAPASPPDPDETKVNNEEND